MKSQQRSRHEDWLQFRSSDVLHRVEQVGGEQGEWPQWGSTICGRVGYVVMPGLLSRMGSPRCKVCCRLLGVPEGPGNTLNAGIEEPT